MILKGQEGHVRSERDVSIRSFDASTQLTLPSTFHIQLLAAAASGGNSEANWIVKLHYSFQDADNLYLVLVSLRFVWSSAERRRQC